MKRGAIMIQDGRFGWLSPEVYLYGDVKVIESVREMILEGKLEIRFGSLSEQKNGRRINNKSRRKSRK